TALDLANGLSLNNSIDMKDSNSIQSLLDTIENLLKPIDDARADLSENSHIKSVIAEYIEYFVEGMPTEVESMSMFKYAKDYLADFNYETESYIDNIPSALVQSYIDSNESSNAFLKFVDVSSYNYEKLSSELFKMPNLIKIFGSASNLSASDVKSALTSTDIAKQVVSGLLSEYYTDGSITEATLDYDKESSAIASALNYSNSSDDSLELSAIPTLIDSLCSSDLLPAILDFYSNNGSAVTIKVSLIKKTTIDGLFDTKVLDGELSQKVANTYKAMFTV
ncbi:MAG: hypothetical protein K6G38_03240, partial [Gammaproteobacteria bacterium]|nr:hypothetical protein [Gammaproteobacteria bacterium]